MKRPPPTESRARFSTPLRHYHRSNNRRQPSWDDWVDGDTAKPRGTKKGRWRVIGIILALLALSGIVAGLIIELG